MANKKLTIVSLAIIFFFALSLANPPVEQGIGSQTREVGIQQSKAGSGDLYEVDKALGAPTYNYGSSSGGSYIDTQSSNNVYQISVATQEAPSSSKNCEPSSVSERDMFDSSDLAWTSPTNIYDFDSNYASVAMPNGWVLRYTHYSVASGFGFSIPSDAVITAITIGYYRKSNYASATYNTQTLHLYLGTSTTTTVGDDMNDLGTYWGTSGEWFYSTNTTHGYSWTYSLINSLGFSVHVGARLYNNYGSGAGYPTCYVDVVRVSVWYTFNHFRIDYSYLFRYTGPLATVKTLNWTAEGKTNSSKATIWLYNYVSSGWDNTSCSFTTTEATYSTAVNYLYYINATGYMKMRLSQLDATSSLAVSVDYLAWTIVYSTISGTIYQSVIASKDPTYIYGSTSSGSYTDTRLIDSAYQVAQSASYSGGTTNSMKTGTLATNFGSGNEWFNPSYATGSPDSSGAYNQPISSPAYNKYLKVYHYDFAVVGTIQGIYVTIYHRADYATYNKDNDVYLIKTGDTTVGSNKADTSTWWGTAWEHFHYGGSSDLWGTSWTASEINADSFAVAIRCYGGGSLNCYVDAIEVTVYYELVYYRLSYYYYFYFTDAVRSKVGQLGWLINGKTSSPTIPIYIYDWSSLNWYSTGMSLTTTQADKSVSSVNINNCMASNGTMILRFFKDSEAASFTVSIDFMKWDIVYEPKMDTTKPSTPQLFYPLEEQYVSDLPLLTWNESTDDLSGVSYYRVAVSASPSFTTTALNTTTIKTWYQFSTSLNYITYYWKVRAIDKSGNIGDWSSTRIFTPTSDPQVNVVFRNVNNPSLNEIINPAQFNTTYHRSIQDTAGVWNTLSPYNPIINIYTTELVNITVRDWLGNYIVNNQQYSYSPTIVVNLNVYDVCVGNGADAMAYIILRSGTIILHKFTYRSDIHWLVIAGVYNLTVIYPSVGNIQVYYNLTISGDYGIKVSSNVTADLYSASTNWDLLTSNVASIVTTVQGVKTDVYNMGWTQADMNRNIQAVANQVGNLEKDTNIFTGGSMTIVGILAAIIPFMTIFGKIVTHFQPSPDPDQIADAKARKIAQKIVNDYISGGHGPTVTPDSTGTSTHVGPYPVKPRPARARR